jgi:gluconokinase
MRPILIFMGVSGTGKSTVAHLFAQRTGARFHEGDVLHPKENIEKMRKGQPLTDEDRAGWLKTLRKLIQESIQRDELAAFTCSALKASYRQILKGDDQNVYFVHVTATREELEKRMKNRPGHFMPASLLDSQLATLEPPTDAYTFDAELKPNEIVTKLIEQLMLDRKL